MFVRFYRPNPVFTPEYSALRDAVIEARRAAGLSQRDLAARIGRAASHISVIERGQRRIDSLELFFIAEACGVDAVELYARACERVRAVRAAETIDGAAPSPGAATS